MVSQQHTLVTAISFLLFSGLYVVDGFHSPTFTNLRRHDQQHATKRTSCWAEKLPGDINDRQTTEKDTPLLNRRDLLEASAASTLLAAFMLTSKPQNVFAEETSSSSPTSSPQTIVMTGANSGIGFEACKRLSEQGHTVVLACRTQEKADTAVQNLKEVTTNANSVLIPCECDLTSMASIQSFADRLPSLIGKDQKIDCLCLNAGIARNTEAKDVARTADGFELTVGTNHFGHFYLNHLLLPKLNTSTGRIVVTASGVHDPESPGGAQGVPATLGTLEGLKRDGRACEMIDGSPFNADKAYKDSKLCNVLFTRELQRRLSNNGATKSLVVNCFNPGLIVSTGLFRDQNPLFTKLFDFAATDLLKVGETPAWGGGALAYMTNVSTEGLYYSSDPGSSKYGDAAFGKQFNVVTPSKEARDDAKAKQFWELSEQLLGISSAI